MCENVAISLWAKQIREIKIRELKELIDLYQESLSLIRTHKLDNAGTIFRQLWLVDEIKKLKQKLYTLETATTI